MRQQSQPPNTQWGGPWQTDLNMLDTATGEQSTVWSFYEGMPFVVGWLSDTQALVEVKTLTTILDDSGSMVVQERSLHTLVIDIVSGELWRYEGMNGQPIVWAGVP